MPVNDPLTRRLLGAGLLAGPMALTVDFSLAFLREGFDLHRHASSQLALGEYGWVQSMNFTVAGVLMLIFAFGARRSLKGSPGGFWAPLLLGVFAISHVLVGVFATDPAFGFPPGTPEGIPDYAAASTHAVIHSLAGGIGFNVLAAACFVLAWRFGRAQLRWMAFSLFTAAVIIAIGVYAGTWEAAHTEPAVRATAQFDFLPMWASLPLIWGYLTALAWKLRRDAEVFHA